VTLRNGSTAVQDAYPEDFAHCFGCGRLNTRGHLLRTFWDGKESRSEFTPSPYHIAVPGFVYGGLLASLLDCHGMATAAAAALEADGRVIGEVPSPRYVTAALHVDFVRPTPLGPTLEVRARVEAFTPRKVRVNARIVANGEVTARAAIVAVPMPEGMQRPPGT
jgi:acyl-coenzyme A thioesterase PaaI-like protein